MPAATATAEKRKAAAPRSSRAVSAAPEVIPDHPARRADVEKWLDERGVRWRFDPEVPLSDIDVETSLRNQARLGEPVHQETVDTYKEAMKNGDPFPALLRPAVGVAS